MGPIGGDRLVGGILLMVGGVASYLSWHVGATPWGGESARLFPLIISLAIAAMSLLLLVQSFGPVREALSLGKETRDVVFLSLIGIAYIALISKVGYLLATGLCAPLGFWIFGVRSWMGLILAALLCPLAYHLIFFVALGIFPPYGEWFDLLDLF